ARESQGPARQLGGAPDTTDPQAAAVIAVLGVLEPLHAPRIDRRLLRVLLEQAADRVVRDDSMQVNHPGPDQRAVNLAAGHEHRHIGAAGVGGADSSRRTNSAARPPPPRSRRYWSALAAYFRIWVGSSPEISSKNHPQDVYMSRRWRSISRSWRVSTWVATSRSTRRCRASRVASPSALRSRITSM